MALLRYTREELFIIKSSPLVRKPDGLPSVEQWMEMAQPDQIPRSQRRLPQGRGEDQNGGEGANMRALFATRQSTRGNQTSTEDVGLYPPKMAFTSNARGPNRTSEGVDPSATGEESKRDRPSFGKFSRETDAGRNRDRNGLLGSRDLDRDEEGWTSVKSRRSFGHEDGERWQRNGDRDRDRDRNRNPFQRNSDRDGDTRRAGGRNRFDKPWSRDDTQENSRDQETRGFGRGGGWRDRERREDRGDWMRGGRFESKAEDMPEWMDEPREETAKDDTLPTHGVEDFERWKAMQRAKKPAGEDKADVDTPTSALTDVPAEAKATTTADPGRLFGMWGETKKPEVDENAAAAKKAAAKAKASKFAGFFGAQKMETPQEPPSAASPAPVSNAANDADKAGFNKILQMLSQSNISSPPPTAGQAQPPPPAQDQTTLNAFRKEMEQRDMRRPQEFTEDVPFFDRINHNGQPPPQPFVPQTERFTSPAQERSPFRMGRPSDTPSRNGAPNGKDGPFGIPDVPPMDPNQAFLLNLMNSHQNSAQRQGTLSPSADLNSSFVFPENKLPKQPVPQSHRGPPPNLFDDAAIAEHQQRLPRDMDMPELSRKKSQPTGAQSQMFDDPAIAGLQRRNTGQSAMPPQQQQIGNMMGFPGPSRQQPMPQQPDEMFLKSLQAPPSAMPRHGGHQDGPGNMPPGMRLPPGFGGPPPGMHHNMGPPGLQHPSGPPGLQGIRGPNMMNGPPGPPHGLPQNFFAGPNVPSPGGLPPPLDPRMGAPMGIPPGLHLPGMPGGGRGMVKPSPEEIIAMQQQQQQQHQRGGGRNGGFGM